MAEILGWYSFRTLTTTSSSSSTTPSDYTVQTLELKLKVSEFGQYGKGKQVKWRKVKKNMKNDRNSRENGRKPSMWSLNMRKSGEENLTRNARGGGKESKAIEQYTPLYVPHFFGYPSTLPPFFWLNIYPPQFWGQTSTPPPTMNQYGGSGGHN